MPHWESAQRQILARLSRLPDAATGTQALALLDNIGLIVTPGEVSARAPR